MVYDTANMNSLVKEYETLKGKLEDLLDDYTSKKRRHKKTKRKKARRLRAPSPAAAISSAVPSASAVHVPAMSSALRAPCRSEHS